MSGKSHGGHKLTTQPHPGDMCAGDFGTENSHPETIWVGGLGEVVEGGFLLEGRCIQCGGFHGGGQAGSAEEEYVLQT